MDSRHEILKDACPKCGCRSATVHYCKGTCVVATIICDGCGADLV